MLSLPKGSGSWGNFQFFQLQEMGSATFILCFPGKKEKKFLLVLSLQHLLSLSPVWLTVFFTLLLPHPQAAIALVTNSLNFQGQKPSLDRLGGPWQCLELRPF